MALYRDLDVGDALRIGPDIVVRLERKTGQRARLRIESPVAVEHIKDPAAPAAGQGALTRGQAPAAPVPEPPADPAAVPFLRRAVPA